MLIHLRSYLTLSEIHRTTLDCRQYSGGLILHKMINGHDSIHKMIDFNYHTS